MRRRTLLIRLLLVLKAALLAPAWGGEDRTKGKGYEDKEKGRRERKEEDQVPGRYYGQLEGVEEDTLWMGGRALKVQTPLLPYLAPGMVVEVGPEGISVLSPSPWAYYQGPGRLVGLGQGSVRVWWTEGGVVWRALSGDGGQAFLVARYWQGAWQAVPKGFALPRPPKEGWWLLALDGQTGRLLKRLE